MRARARGSVIVSYVLAFACGGGPSQTVPHEPTPPVVTPSEPKADTAAGLGAAVQCTRSFAHLPAIDRATMLAVPVTPLDELGKVAKPGERHAVEGYAVAWHECAPCPEGAACKPCESYVVLATSAAVGIKQPITPDLDVWVMTAEPDALVRGTRYRVVVDVCDGPSPFGSKAHVEWRGSSAVDQAAAPPPS